MLNNVTLQGRLTKDPELRYTMTGTPVASFGIAVERDYKGQDGKRETDFFDVCVWNGTAEFVSKHFTKGRAIIVNGQLRSRKWQDKQGNSRVSVEVVADDCYFGDSKKGSNTKDEFGNDEPEHDEPSDDGDELPL